MKALKEITWWLWTLTGVLLAAELAGVESAFTIVVLLTTAQLVWMTFRERNLAAFPAQVRIGFLFVLGICYIPPFHWLLWVVTVATFARVLFGYCMMARILSLMPWNREVPLTVSLVTRTFFSPPVTGNIHQG